MGKIKFAMQQQKQKIKTKLKNGDCLIEVCQAAKKILCGRKSARTGFWGGTEWSLPKA